MSGINGINIDVMEFIEIIINDDGLESAEAVRLEDDVNLIERYYKMYGRDARVESVPVKITRHIARCLEESGNVVLLGLYKIAKFVLIISEKDGSFELDHYVFLLW